MLNEDVIIFGKMKKLMMQLDVKVRRKRHRRKIDIKGSRKRRWEVDAVL